jgi:hypothetical protein
MNQEQQFLLKNLQNMIYYIKQESETKIKQIQKDAIDKAELGRLLLIEKRLL